MKTLQSALKFFRTWCNSRDIELVSSDLVVVPHAVYDRDNNRKIIYMPLLSLINFNEWQRQGYHESAHLSEKNIWHYDVMQILGNKKGVMLHDISNCLIDNLAERVDFYEYRGRAEVLSSGRADFAERIGDVMRKDANDPKHLLTSALLKWDVLNREQWMINFVFPPAHEVMPHLDKLYQKTEDIQLTRIIDEVAASDDIPANTKEMVELCLEIDSWIHSQNGNKQQPEKGSGEEGEDADENADPQAGENSEGSEGEDSEGAENSSQAGQAGEAEEDISGKGNGSDTGDGEDSGAGDSSGAGEDQQQGGEGSQEQSGDSSDSGSPSKSVATPDGQAPTGQSSPGSNFNPNDLGAEITEVRYTQKELEALGGYTKDIERSIEDDMGHSVKETHQKLRKLGVYKPYTPCEKQELIQIRKDGTYREDRKKDILRYEERSTLDKQMRKHLQLRSSGRTIHGVKRGRLSSKNLHKLYSGGSQIQPAVFKRNEQGKVKLDSAVTLLIDMSGSMGSGSHAGKYNLAAASTISFAEVLNGLRIKHEIIGFTHSPSRNVMYLLKAFNEKPLSKTGLAEKLSSSRIQQDHNADGEAIMFAAERLMQMNEKNKVMMVLSDGQPNGYWVGDGKHYLRAVVEDIEKHSPIHLCAIGIKTSSVSQYYTNYEVVRDIEQLAGAVLNTLKTNLLTM